MINRFPGLFMQAKFIQCHKYACWLVGVSLIFYLCVCHTRKANIIEYYGLLVILFILVKIYYWVCMRVVININYGIWVWPRIEASSVDAIHKLTKILPSRSITIVHRLC